MNSSRRVSSHLQAGTRSSGAGHSGFTLRNALIVAQVSISFMLLVIAGLTLRSFDKLQKVNPGYEAENVVSFALPNNFTKYGDASGNWAIRTTSAGSIAGTAGSDAGGRISGLPLNNPTPFLQQIVVEKQVQDANAAKTELDVTTVSRDGVQNTGHSDERGRDFQRSDTPESEMSTILARRLRNGYLGRRRSGRQAGVGRPRPALADCGRRCRRCAVSLGWSSRAMDALYVCRTRSLRGLGTIRDPDAAG